MTRTDVFCYDADIFFNGENYWQASLLQQITGLTAAQASWKPSPERNSIWEITRHINFWKEYIVALYQGRERPNIDLFNWSASEELTDDAWQMECERTISMHTLYMSIVISIGDELFNTESRIANQIRQLIHHDAYHNGQIGLLRSLQGIKAIV